MFNSHEFMKQKLHLLTPVQLSAKVKLVLKIFVIDITNIHNVWVQTTVCTESY